MSDEPTGQGRVVESPQPAAEGKPQPLPATKKRPLKKVLALLVLGFLGLALLLGAFFLYPRTTELPAAGYTEVDLTTTASVNVIGFEVKTTSFPAKMTVQVLLAPGKPAEPTTLKIWLPIGLRFADCHFPCGVLHTGKLFQSYWTKTLTFKPGADNALQATAKFTVQAKNFGAVFNGVDASATIPEIVYGGPDSPEPLLVTAYSVPSASSYDWSSMPTAATTRFGAEWTEDIPVGDTSARVAVGVDHAAQSDDNTLTFIAGAMLGLAGGAILSAIQEALHVTE